MNAIVSELIKLPKFQDYLQEIQEKHSPVISISGLSDVGKVQYIYATKEASNRPICIVTYNEIQAKRLIEDLKYFAKEFETIYYFPKKEIATYDYVLESKDLLYNRIDVLNKLEQNKAKIVVTTIEAMMQKMVAKSTLYEHKLEMKVGKNYSLEELKQTLIDLGYERSDLVEGKGQFSLRGDILDIALSEKEGVRVEFWGEEIDSIRKFNLSSQRSTDMIQKIEIMPAHELILEKELPLVIKEIEEGKLDFNEEIEARINIKKEYKQKLEEIKSQDIALIEANDYLSKMDKYFNYFYEKQQTFMDYLEKDFLIIFDELSKVKQREENILMENRNLMKVLLEKEKYIPQSIQNLEKIEYVREDKQIILYLEKQDFGIAKVSPVKFQFSYRDVNYYKSEMELLIGDFIKWLNEKKNVVVLAGNEEETEKFIKLLEEKEVPYKKQDLNQISNLGMMQKDKLSVQTDSELRTTYAEANVSKGNGPKGTDVPKRNVPKGTPKGNCVTGQAKCRL